MKKIVCSYIFEGALNLNWVPLEYWHTNCILSFYQLPLKNAESYYISRVNNLINSAYLGKNMYFSSVTQIQSPHQNPMGNLDSISIMKKRNLGINEANRRFQHPRPAAEFEDNQKKFIQVSSYILRMPKNLKKKSRSLF